MAYPDRLLGVDEELVEHLHPHWIRLVPAVVWFVALCAAAGVAAYFAPSSGTGREIVAVAIAVVGMALLARFVLRPWLRWRSVHYVFTTRRVLLRRGVFTREGRDIPLNRINDVGFEQTLWDRVVGAGSLTIESAGEHGEERLLDVPHADRVQHLLNELIDEDAERRHRGPDGDARTARG